VESNGNLGFEESFLLFSGHSNKYYKRAKLDEFGTFWNFVFGTSFETKL